MAETEVKEEFPHKVFVGNLSFKSTEDELKEFFSVAGTVVNVNIIKRGTRSLGYGFIAFSSEAECQAAVEKCHKKMLGEREINVEAAKPKSELEKEKKERRKKVQGGGHRRRPIRRRRKRGAPRQKDTEDGVVVSHGDSGDKKQVRMGDRRPRRRGIRGKGKKPRTRRVPTGEPSKTTIFVANLPFSLNDDSLKDVFKDFKVKTAKVVVVRRTGRSKGFGFVEFEDETSQKSVLEATSPFVSEGRELNIKVALSDQKPIEEAEAKKEEQTA